MCSYSESSTSFKHTQMNPSIENNGLFRFSCRKLLVFIHDTYIILRRMGHHALVGKLKLTVFVILTEKKTRKYFQKNR